MQFEVLVRMRERVVGDEGGTCDSSVCSERRNLRRAGVLKKSRER